MHEASIDVVGLCVCKPAAAKLTSNYERSQAWHSATDWMQPSPSSASTSCSDPTRSVLVAYSNDSGLKSRSPLDDVFSLLNAWLDEEVVDVYAV